MKGEILKDKRIDAGMTQKELAEKVGCSPAAIMRYEANQREPKQEVIEKIAEVLNVHPMELYPLDEWEETYNPEQHLAKEIATLESVKKQYGKNAIDLLEVFNELNEDGKKKAIELVEYLTEVQHFKKTE